MNLPTQHQVAVAGTVVASSAASVIATLGFVHLLNPADAANATAAISQIGDGIAKIMAGTGTLITIGGTVYATVKSSPLLSLLRSSKAVASDPALQDQLKTVSVADQVQLVTVTDKLPDVANVGMARTEAGRAIAMAVPSPTVQQISPTSMASNPNATKAM